MHNGQYSHSHQQDLYVTEAAVSKIRYRHGICDWSVFFHANQYNYSVLWINIMYWSQACTVSTSNSLERALIGVVVILYSINGAKVFSLNMRRCVIFRCSFLLPSFCFCLPFTLNSLLTHTRTHTHTHTHTPPHLLCLSVGSRQEKSAYQLISSLWEEICCASSTPADQSDCWLENLPVQPMGCMGFPGLGDHVVLGQAPWRAAEGVMVMSWLVLWHLQ